MSDDAPEPDGRTAPPIRSHHDWSLDSAFDAVVAAVAVAADREPVSLAPLHEWVDPEALDALFSPTSAGRPSDGLCVTFAYEGYEVTVDGGGSVTVRSGREWRDRPANVQHAPGRTYRMGERDDGTGDRDHDRSDDAVDAAMDDFDDESAAVKTYECDACGHRMEAEHQPGECPVCGGEMIDVSVSRE